MKAPKEIRNWTNKDRKLNGKKNGVIPFYHEDYKCERMLETNKRLVKRPNANDLFYLLETY